jgi:hypothetical protein
MDRESTRGAVPDCGFRIRTKRGPALGLGYERFANYAQIRLPFLLVEWKMLPTREAVRAAAWDAGFRAGRPPRQEKAPPKKKPKDETPSATDLSSILPIIDQSVPEVPFVDDELPKEKR